MAKDTPEYVRILAKEMRNGLTPAEAFLWPFLRRKKLDGYKVYRQYPIGRYIADFYCPEKRLIIELDGRIHEFRKEYDEIRDNTLNGKGYRIARFTNEQVLTEVDAVLSEIRYLLSL